MIFTVIKKKVYILISYFFVHMCFKTINFQVIFRRIRLKNGQLPKKIILQLY